MKRDESIRRLAAALFSANGRAGHRSLVHAAGTAHWCRTLGREFHRRAPGETLWLGESVPPGIDGQPGSRAAEQLGREAVLVVVDARDGFDPDAVGAVAGTLRGGGVLLLLTPPCAEWAQYPDPQSQRIAIEGASAEALDRRYLRRLIRHLETEPDILRLRPGHLPEPGSPSPLVSPWTPAETEDQQAVIRAVERLARGRARRPLVVIADRGRGKSAALGLAAARLLAADPLRILVTAPRRQAVDALYRHAGTALDFLPPAELLERLPPADLLLVDEAAGIPLELLERMLEQYPRVVFASTVHGYEGTGRGFALRFREILDRRAPGWRALKPRAPIRWAADDPLEPVVNRLLLLDAETATPAGDPGTVDLEWLDRDRLAEDEPLLRQVFGLLVQAHYRTRPSDLRNLLDGPGLAVAVARHGQTVVGALLASEEGGFPPPLSQAVWLGRRRPHGHLLAQALTAHAGVPDAATARVGRVMRIAVHARCRGRGIGSRLLDAFRQWAAGRGLDVIGSSFGVSAGLLRFWYCNGYAPAHLGVRRDAASGAHAAVLVQGISRTGEALSVQALRRYRRGLPLWASDYLQDLEPGLLWSLLAPGGFVEPPDADCLEEVVAFARAHRGFEASLGSLHRFAWHGAPLQSARGRAATGMEPVLVRVIQGHGWPESAARLGLSGRGEVVRALRTAFRQLLDETEQGQRVPSRRSSIRS